jgi:hypothetical protein
VTVRDGTLSANHTTTEATDRGDAQVLVSATSTAADQPINREAYYRCLSPLRRKTSELAI